MQLLVTTHKRYVSVEDHWWWFARRVRQPAGGEAAYIRLARSGIGQRSVDLGGIDLRRGLVRLRVMPHGQPFGRQVVSRPKCVGPAYRGLGGILQSTVQSGQLRPQRRSL